MATKRPVAVVPHGSGIGDMVNARPLIAAIAAQAGGVVHVLTPPSLEWLLPPNALPLPQSAPARFWRRPRTVPAPAAALADPHLTGPLMRAAPRSALAAGLSAYLRMQGYRVVSLLEIFAGLDIPARWTPGPWNDGGEHVINVLAEALEEMGIPVALEGRAPHIPSPPRLTGLPPVLLSPYAGSTLKEPSHEFWRELGRRLEVLGIEYAVLAAPGRGGCDAAAWGGPDVSVVQEPDLRNVFNVLTSVRVVVSPDSGILHLTAAGCTPYAGLFGATDPRFLGPYRRDLGIVIQTSRPHAPVCRDCWTAQLLPTARCPVYAPGNCLDGVDVEEAIRAVEELLQREGIQGAATHPSEGSGRLLR